MKTRLKGVAKVHKRLASGRRETYYYAWRGGPRLSGAPGSPEFVDGYQKAHEARRKAAEAEANLPIFGKIIDAYEASPEFLGKSAKTREDYSRYLRPCLRRIPKAALA